MTMGDSKIRGSGGMLWIKAAWIGDEDIHCLFALPDTMLAYVKGSRGRWKVGNGHREFCTLEAAKAAAEVVCRTGSRR